MSHPIDLGTVEVDLPPGYHEARRAASIARVRQWERDNRERYLASRRARYRARNERTCRGIDGETCLLLVTGTGQQRCDWHGYLQEHSLRRARRSRAASR